MARPVGATDTGSEERFSSPLLAFPQGTTATLERLVVEMYARGLSTCDIETSFTDATGGRILSNGMVSEVTARLWQETQAICARRLDDLAVEYLFAEGLDEPLRRTGQVKEALLCLWAIRADGCKVLLEVILGNREALASWLDCPRGLVSRGPRPSVLLTSDGAPGLTAAVEQVFPHALRQRCLTHKTRKVLAKVGAHDHVQVKAEVQSAYYASSRDAARLVAEQVVTRWQATYPSAMTSFLDDFEACIAYLRCPVDHHRYIRTMNLAERAIEEERRRTKVIPRFRDEQCASKLCFAALHRASQRWQRIRMTNWDRLHLDWLRQELHGPEGGERRATTGPHRASA